MDEVVGLACGRLVPTVILVSSHERTRGVAFAPRREEEKVTRKAAEEAARAWVESRKVFIFVVER